MRRLELGGGLVFVAIASACGEPAAPVQTVFVRPPVGEPPAVSSREGSPPRAAAAPSAAFPPPGDDEPGTLRVYVDAAGRIGVRGAVVDLDALRGVAGEVAATQPDLRAVIFADRAVTYGRVMEVMDRLRQAGINRVAFAAAAE